MLFYMPRQWVFVFVLLQFILCYFYYYIFSRNVADVGKADKDMQWFDGIRETTTKFPKESFVNWRSLLEGKQLTADVDWTKIKRKPSPKAEDMNDKWIVLTSINAPTKDVKRLAAITGWKVVVVGDKKTPQDWR